MAKSFIFLAFALAFSANCKANIATFSDLKLDVQAGYCENPNKEKEMWSGINKFAKSIKDTLPGIPPAQAAYIEAEKNSNNNDRRMNLESYPFYIISKTLVMADNMDKLSELYIANQNRLGFPKKVEITARTLFNVTAAPFEFDYINTLERKLAENDYKIDGRHLRTLLFSLWRFKPLLLNHLICYGEKTNP